MNGWKDKDDVVKNMMEYYSAMRKKETWSKFPWLVIGAAVLPQSLYFLPQEVVLRLRGLSSSGAHLGHCSWPDSKPGRTTDLQSFVASWPWNVCDLHLLKHYGQAWGLDASWTWPRPTFTPHSRPLRNILLITHIFQRKKLRFKGIRELVQSLTVGKGSSQDNCPDQFPGAPNFHTFVVFCVFPCLPPLVNLLWLLWSYAW